MPYQYLLMRSGAGLSVHLAESRASTSLCGRSVTALELRTPFELNGCALCAKAAVKAGTDYVVDVTGDRIDLDGFKPFSHG